MKKSKKRVVRFKKIQNPERLSTGIKNLDPLIEGGLEKNSVNLVVGPAGSGKSILAMQFLMDGLKRGEPCLFVTFEEKKDEFYSNMLDFGWDLRSYENKKLFTFLEYTPEKVKTMLEEGGGSIENIILSKKISRLAIDSITSFALLFDNELAKRQAALTLFNMIRDWKCTSIITLEEESTGKEKSVSQKLEFETDSIIVLYYILINQRRERFLEILKMRSTNHSNKIYPVEMGKKGLELEKKPVSKKVTDAI